MKTFFRHKILHGVLLIIFCALMSLQSSAQVEPMFTQYMFNESFINPAYAGSHDNISAALLYRNQWAGMDGAPTTQTFNIHAPAHKQKLGLGFSVMNESIGVTHQMAMYGNFAYRILMPNSTMAFGLQGGFVNDEEKYTDVHTITPGDNQFAMDVKKYFLPNAGFGMYYYTDRFYAGFSIPRLLENKIDPAQPDAVVKNFGNLKVWHYYLSTGYVFNLSEGLKFKPSMMVKAVQNAPLELDVNANFLFRDFLWLGTAYRTGDAASLMVGFQLTQQLRLGYSYDYTLTDLQKFNSGSHEFTISYDFSFDKNRVISPRYF
jgi:type IX secretion system PorP/SprF family membrane protein